MNRRTTSREAEITSRRSSPSTNNSEPIDPEISQATPPKSAKQTFFGRYYREFRSNRLIITLLLATLLLLLFFLTPIWNKSSQDSDLSQSPHFQVKSGQPRFENRSGNVSEQNGVSGLFKGARDSILDYFRAEFGGSDLTDSQIDNALTVIEDYKRAIIHESHNRTLEEKVNITDVLNNGRDRFWLKLGNQDISEEVEQACDTLATVRKTEIRNAFKEAWDSYKQYAWGADELRPMTLSRYDWMGMGAMIVDNLDSLVMLNMRNEFAEALDWVKEMKFDTFDGKPSLFEVNIRILGGLLSGYYMTKEEVLLNKAQELADLMLEAFEVSHGLFPYSFYNFKTKEGTVMPKRGGEVSLAEIGSLQLEFRALAKLLRDDSYREKVDKISEFITSNYSPRISKVIPSGIDPSKIEFRKDSEVGVGGNADSFFEYLLKQYIQSGKTETRFLKFFQEQVAGIIETLVRYDKYTDNIILIKKKSSLEKWEMEELSCFFPGTLIKAAQLLRKDDPNRTIYTNLAKELTHTCIRFYETQPTRLAPDNIEFSRTRDVQNLLNPEHRLRPETVESLYYMYTYTKDPIYREWAWRIFKDINKKCKTTHAFAALQSVTGHKHQDRMDTFFLSETLKYLYLIFDDNTVVDLEQWVFNTQAHPFKVFSGWV